MATLTESFTRAHTHWAHSKIVLRLYHDPWWPDNTSRLACRCDNMFELVVDQIGLRFSPVGPVGLREEPIGLFIWLKLYCPLQLMEHDPGIGELFLDFGVSNMPCRKTVFQFER